VSFDNDATADGIGDGPLPGVDEEPALSPGTLLGAYTVFECIGDGAMGRVYRAKHAVIGRQVALKVLKKHRSESFAAVERFFAEARGVNRIRHPGIVQVTDFFVDDKTPCIVMELLEGETLGQELLRGRLTVERTIGIGVQIASALAASHAAGVIHRDLKPDNIFLVAGAAGAAGRVKVLDFGVAKLTDDGVLAPSQTRDGAVVGTPEYMAPEQLSATRIDARVDVYALGAVLYHCVTGQPPFRGESFGDYVVKHLTAAPRAPRSLAPMPRELDRVLLRMLEKDPAARPSSMDDVVAQLSRATAPQRKRPVAALVAVAAVAVAVAGAATLALTAQPAPHAVDASIAVAAPPAFATTAATPAAAIPAATTSALLAPTTTATTAAIPAPIAASKRAAHAATAVVPAKASEPTATKAQPTKHGVINPFGGP
jgi:serine/threonine-protein kinase